MQKTIKRIALLLVLAIAVTCAAVFATACGNTETEYSVQVICDDDVDFTKLGVHWCKADASGNPTGNCYPQVTLDNEGKATCSTDLSAITSQYGFHVELDYLDTIGYTYAENQNFIVTAPGTLTIKIVKAN